MDFVGKRNWFFLLSVLIILPGVVFLLIAPGLRPGIDFTGGSSTSLEFQAEVDQGDLRDEMALAGHPDSIVQKLADRTFFIRTKELSEEAKDSLVETLQAKPSPDGIVGLSFDLVSSDDASQTVTSAFL